MAEVVAHSKFSEPHILYMDTHNYATRISMRINGLMFRTTFISFTKNDDETI